MQAGISCTTKCGFNFTFVFVEFVWFASWVTFGEDIFFGGNELCMATGADTDEGVVTVDGDGVSAWNIGFALFESSICTILILSNSCELLFERAALY